MNTKTILGFSFAAIFSIGMISAAFAGASSWVGATGGDAEMKNAKVWRLSVTALDDIPEKAVGPTVTETERRYQERDRQVNRAALLP